MRHHTPSRRGGTILAFDFGLRRIGVAVGEREPATAAALTTCAASDGEPDWPALEAIVAEWQPAVLVVGVPRREDGTEGFMAEGSREFAQRLRTHFDAKVELVDESFSSRSAREELRQKRRSGMLRRRVKRGDADRIAARLILETWLAGQPLPSATHSQPQE